MHGNVREFMDKLVNVEKQLKELEAEKFRLYLHLNLYHLDKLKDEISPDRWHELYVEAVGKLVSGERQI